MGEVLAIVFFQIVYRQYPGEKYPEKQPFPTQRFIQQPQYYAAEGLHPRRWVTLPREEFREYPLLAAAHEILQQVLIGELTLPAQLADQPVKHPPASSDVGLVVLLLRGDSNRRKHYQPIDHLFVQGGIHHADVRAEGVGGQPNLRMLVIASDDIYGPYEVVEDSVHIADIGLMLVG